MRIKRIPTKADGNELFPLPPDYLELTEEGQREARINACRQWLVPTSDSEDKALRFMGAMIFFEKWYLSPDESDDFNPMFFDEEPVPIPPGHLGIYKEWATSRSSINRNRSSWFRKKHVHPQVHHLANALKTGFLVHLRHLHKRQRKTNRTDN
mgnify:CR=1 FL=1